MLNVGTADRIFRIVLGLAVLSLVFVGPKTPWAWLGLIPLGTGVMGWCPLYSVLKMRTKPRPA
jgi:Inner membrane protein YgaP-like, transmembrane domain